MTNELAGVSLELNSLEFTAPVLEDISSLIAADFSIAPQPYAAISIPQIEITAPALAAVWPPAASWPSGAVGAARGHAVLVSTLLARRHAIAHLYEAADRLFAAAMVEPKPMPLAAPAYAVAHISDHGDRAHAVAWTEPVRLQRAA